MDSESRAIELLAIRDNLREGRAVPPITVRDLLSWFDAMRRGFWVVTQIKSELRQFSLKTEPDFEEIWIDDSINFALVPDDTSKIDDASDTQIGTNQIEESTIRSPDITRWLIKDPTYRVSRLQAANQDITSIHPGGTLSEVVTLLLSKSTSQLPVMTNERNVKGIITWKSIGLKLSLGVNAAIASELMEPHKEIRFDDSIFDAIPIIVENGYVLIRSKDERISGILTANDLSLQFRKLTEPFLLLSEIENLVRNMIGNRYSKTELVSACDPDVEGRQIEGVGDMTFGEYIRLLQNPDRWNQLYVKVDRKIFCSNLDRIRQIRNDVMHFDTDGITDEELQQLRDFASFMKQLETTLNFSKNPAA
jgi:CBS domain-containing protein